MDNLPERPVGVASLDKAAIKKFKADKKAGIMSGDQSPSRGYIAGKKAVKKMAK